MAVKRKDKKGRILKDGESQRSNGRYEYKFIDSDGERRSVYSWRLVESDVTPAGKKQDVPLRVKEQEIQSKLQDEIVVSAQKTTLNELFILHMSLVELSNATRENYNYMWDKFVKDSLGKAEVDKLKKSDILKFYSDKKKSGMADGTIQMFQKMIKPSLQLAVEDHLIRSNPAAGCCKKYAGEDADKKIALTKEQVDIFFEELHKYGARQDYEPLFHIMLGLSCRRGELIGLTWKDVDMQEKTVTIDHSVLYRRKDGVRQFYAKSTKTCNTRVIPMTQEVYDSFAIMQERHLYSNGNAEVDGYSDFIFTSATGDTPLYPDNINNIINKIVKRYNRTAEKPLPNISCHIFRHTGCTRMAEAGVDINTICYIMGHSSFKMVLKVYDHVNLERARKQMSKLDEPDEKAS